MMKYHAWTHENDDEMRLELCQWMAKTNLTTIDLCYKMGIRNRITLRNFLEDKTVIEESTRRKIIQFIADCRYRDLRKLNP
jgi:hypothetical protein